ncbi:hypothetical protein RJ55_07485 [Drechmeria coniospora]|nr:hypothetical protein RJ55_07485 [Drechmeria coniospora]
MANQYISTPYGQTPLTAKGAAISVYPHPAVAQAPIPPYGSQTSETIDLTGSMAPPAEGAGVQESELPTGQFGFEMSSSALAPLNPDGIEPTAIADVGNEMATVGQCTSADQLPIPISDELVTDDQTIGDIAPSPSCVFEADYQPFMGYDAEHQEAGGLQKQISETLEGLMPPPTIAPSKLAQQLVQTEQAAGHQAALAAPVPSAIDPSPVAPGPAPPALDAGPVHVAYPTQGYGQGGDGVAIGYNPMVFDARAMSDQIGNGGVYLRPSGTMTHKTTQAIGNVPAHLSTAEAYATGDDPHEEKVLNNRALKKARDPRCDPKRVYKTKIPQLLPWGPTNTEGKHKYQYTKHGQLAAGQTLTAEEILYYINHRKRHGNFVIWIQNAPSQCAARQDEDDKKCRYSKCPLAKRSISSGWLRAAFDEFPHLTSDGTKDPFKVAILLHLWCLEQICDVFSLFQDGVLRADNRVFPKEAVNAMTLDRDVNRAAVRDAFDPWMRIQLEELVNNNCCSSWPRPHELSLSFELIAHHIGNQTTARQRARYLRNLNKPAGHHKTIDVHMGNLGLYVGIATTSRNEKRAARSQALIQLEEQNEETKVLVGDVADAVADAVAVADADADADVDADGEFVDGDEGLVGNIDVVDQDEPASRELQEGDRRGEVGTNPKSTSRSTKGATRKKANARTKRRKADTLLDEGADDGGPGEEWIDLASPNSWKGSKDLVAAVDLSPYSDPVAHFSNALPAGIFYSPSSGIMRGSIVDAGIRERARRESVASSLRDEDQDSSSRKRRRDGECDEPGDESMSKKQRSDENYASVDDGDGAPCKKRRREETIDAMTTTTTIVKKARLSKDEESSGESDGAPTGQHGTSRSRSEFGSLFGSPSDAGLDTGAAACPTPREKAFSPARAAADKRDGGDGPENGDGRQASGEPRDETR